MAESVPASVTDDYAQRVTADLEGVRREKDRVHVEIARLQGVLEQLEQSETVLTQMEAVLSGAPGTSKGSKGKAANRAAAAVPAARSTREASSRTSGTASKGGQSGTKGKAGRKDGGKRGKRGSAGAAGGPTWPERVLAYLGAQKEPRTAAEVSEALSQAQGHPASSPVVRNALEQAVAKGLVERSKQGRSVFYTAVPTPAAPTAPKDAESGETASRS
ncbi:hypothetical protein ACFVV7_26505 [Streptomyces globisporus]|uniref:hypothetical protein n=1 Tax=Streptomyces globisporus TaxID=1908 RepID=UPI0036D7E337